MVVKLVLSYETNQELLGFLKSYFSSVTNNRNYVQVKDGKVEALIVCDDGFIPGQIFDSLETCKSLEIIAGDLSLPSEYITGEKLPSPSRESEVDGEAQEDYGTINVLEEVKDNSEANGKRIRTKVENLPKEISEVDFAAMNAKGEMPFLDEVADWLNLKSSSLDIILRDLVISCCEIGPSNATWKDILDDLEGQHSGYEKSKLESAVRKSLDETKYAGYPLLMLVKYLSNKVLELRKRLAAEKAEEDDTKESSVAINNNVTASAGSTEVTGTEVEKTEVKTDIQTESNGDKASADPGIKVEDDNGSTISDESEEEGKKKEEASSEPAKVVPAKTSDDNADDDSVVETKKTAEEVKKTEEEDTVPVDVGVAAGSFDYIPYDEELEDALSRMGATSNKVERFQIFMEAFEFDQADSENIADVEDVFGDCFDGVPVKDALSDLDVKVKVSTVFNEFLKSRGVETLVKIETFYQDLQTLFGC